MKDSWKVKLAVAAVSAAFWVASTLINNRLFAIASAAPGIDVIFIPSGVRLIALLIGGEWAAIGIALGSLVLIGPEFGISDWREIALLALATGLFPLLALLATMRLLGVGSSLRKLSPAHLPLIGLGVAVGSSVLHCLLYGFLGLQPWHALGGNILAMATGDFTGTLLALVLVFAFLRLSRRRAG